MTPAKKLRRSEKDETLYAEDTACRSVEGLAGESSASDPESELRDGTLEEGDAAAAEASQPPDEKEAATKHRARAHKQALAALKAAQNKGVVYLSRIPPHMKPQKLRHLLSQYGELGRVYLAPEDPAVRKRRKKLKGNTGKNFSEGWVEFVEKRVAKRVAVTLNGNPMGGKRRSTFQYDIWCMKYLPKFKWDYLTEEIAYQRAVRDQKLAAEFSAAKKERDFYLSRVDRAKAAEARQKRQEKREAAEGEQRDGGASAAVNAERSRGPRIVRSYGQRMAKPDPTDDAEAPVLARDVLSLLAGRK